MAKRENRRRQNGKSDTKKVINQKENYIQKNKKKEKAGHRRDNNKDFIQIGDRNLNKKNIEKKFYGNNQQKNINNRNVKGKYQTNNFGNENNNRSNINNKKDKKIKSAVYNDEIEISNNIENNFFDFESNSNVLTKLKNFEPNLNENKNENIILKKTAGNKNNNKKNNTDMSSWKYKNIITEENHFQDIKKKRQQELQESLNKEDPDAENMEIDDYKEKRDNEEKNDELNKNLLSTKKRIDPSLKSELDKRLQKGNENKDEDSSENDEVDDKFHDKFESDIYTKNMSFCDFNLSKLILRGCSDLEFFHPTKVQEKVIPIILKNEDVFVNSETGSGKTACYLLPIIQKIIQNKNSKNQIKSLIILPTRELAFQCGEMLKSFIKHVDVSFNLICGGMSIEKQTLELKNELDVIIATPGRLIDMIYNYRSLSLEFINILVLDEADKLLELGFKDAIIEIINLMKNNQNRQTLLFSATLNPKIIDLGKHTLKNPVKIKMAESAVLKNLKQKILRMQFKNMEENESEKRLAYLIDLIRDKKRTIIFFNTKKECHKAFIFLEKFGLNSGELHSDIDQTMRLKSLDDFQSGKINFLLATDIAGRGIDIEKVKYVVNFQMPLTKDRYIHRIGRTARKGYNGEAITICNDKDRQLLKKIMKKENFVLGQVKINNNEIKNIYKILCENKNQVNQICEDEELEKEIERAEKDVTKAFNMTNYKSEIMNKPKK